MKKKIKQKRCKPGLAVILVGENPASKLYVKLKTKAAERVGIRVILRSFSVKAGAKKIIDEIIVLNRNKNIHGILVQMPLPKGYDTNEVIKIIDHVKDVDKEILPSAIYFAFKKGPGGKKKNKVVALVNSDFLGKSLKKFFLRKKVKINYLLKKDFLPSKINSANVIITALGCHKLIKGDMIKKGVVLIDAGIPADVDKESVKNKAAFLTPVPGGIGPLVVALLLKKVYKNCAYGSCKTYRSY